MTSFYYYVIATLLLETFLVVFFSYKLREKLLPMHRMMLAMIFSMNIGMTFGVLLGTLHQGNLFYSTIISILIAMIAGLFCGVTLGMLPSIEGVMAGLMSGMMGAMLGEMIDESQSTTMINLLLLFSIGSLFLFLILPHKEREDERISNKLWFWKPIVILGGLTLYLLFGFYISKGNLIPFTIAPKFDEGHTQQNPQENSVAVEIEMNDFLYSPSSFKIKRGQQISLKINNKDSMEHDFEVKKINIQNINDHSSHTHQNKSEAAIHLHALPKESNEMKFIPLEPGEYEFYCTIPGHKEAGMKGVLNVIP